MELILNCTRSKDIPERKTGTEEKTFRNFKKIKMIIVELQTNNSPEINENSQLGDILVLEN